jgi:protein TonB
MIAQPATLVAVLALLAPATETAVSSQVMTPQWERLPSSATLDELFPPLARQYRIGGRTWMRCSVTDDGKLQGCAVIKEIPENQGFGDAALRSVRYFKMTPTVRGIPVKGGTVIIPIVWQTDDGAKAPPIPPDFNPATNPSAP